MTVDSGKWGAKIGTRVAMLVSHSMIYTHSRLAALKHKIAMSVFHAISDEISDEIDVTLGPLISAIHDAIDEDHPAYPSIHFMATNRGQLKAIAGSGLQVSGLLGSIATIMNNELAPVVYQFVQANPHLIPAVGDVALMYATGLVSADTATGVIESNGYDSGWAANYVDLAYSYPTSDVGLELLRRGLIGDEDLVKILQRGGLPPDYWGPVAELRNTPVSVADAALAVLRGDITMNDGITIAAQNGFDLNSFNILIGNTGEPPGTEQLLEAKRRGFIDEATLVKGILQSRVRDEWIPTLEKLAYEPISVADAVNAVVQDQMDMATGEQIAEYNGLEPGYFQVLYDTAGEPISPTEAFDLYNRGLATEDQVKQALRESRLKDKYIDLAFNLHTHILPIYTLQRALRYGGVSQQDAVQITMESGYSQDSAEIIVNAGSAERLQTYKDKVVAAAQSLYESNVISQDQALTIIQAMGYSDTEAQFVFESSEFRRNAKLINTAVSAIKAKYLGHHIDRNTTIGDIDALGIPSTQRDQLMQIWDIEYSAYTKLLTPTQIVTAVTSSLITQQDGLSRLVALGYNETDATLLLEGA